LHGFGEKDNDFTSTASEGSSRIGEPDHKDGKIVRKPDDHAVPNPHDFIRRAVETMSLRACYQRKMSR
jgi:hypothetical protein